MTKLKNQYQDLTNALKRFKEILKEPKTEIIRDATIKRFDFTFEAAWKLMQSLIKKNGSNIYGTRTIIREAGKMKIINDQNKWLKFFENRQLSVYAYDDALAEKIFLSAKKFPPAVAKLLATAKTHLDS